MKIRFVTESHLSGDEKKTVDVACRKDLDQTEARIDDVLTSVERVNKRLKVLEKRMSLIEQSLASVDTRLRDDCKEIFGDIIRESLAPVFAVVGHVATGKCAIDKTCAVAKTEKTRKKARKSSAREAKANVGGKRTRVRKIVT